MLREAAATAMQGPDTIDCIAPAIGWAEHWQRLAAARRAGAPWAQALASASPGTPA